MIEWNDANPLAQFWQEGPADYHLDVREMLMAGEEPYTTIMDCVRQLKPGENLRVHALFEPRPLLLQVERMGLQASAERIEADHWVCTLSR